MVRETALEGEHAYLQLGSHTPEVGCMQGTYLRVVLCLPCILFYSNNRDHVGKYSRHLGLISLSDKRWSCFVESKVDFQC